eukprot:g3221.t1
MHPELGFEEFRTSELVADRLRSFGVDELTTGVATTGVVATIHGRLEPSGSSDDEQQPQQQQQHQAVSSVGLRADMDALPMQELNSFDHRSTVDGRFHGCGHDGHTTMLLAAAKHLCATRNFAGTVRLIFQPAEEGLGGGRVMVEDEALFERWPCEEVYGMHNWPSLAFGTFGVRSGPLMAAADRIDVEISGVGAHAAMPHLSVDPVLVGAQVVVALQNIVSRTVDPLDSAVVSVTEFKAGSTHNVIPDSCRLKGTIRCFREETRRRLTAQVKEVSEAVASALGASAVATVTPGFPATVNHRHQADLAAQCAEAVVGADKVDRAVAPTMGAEDFSYMLNARPGCYAFLGVDGDPTACNVHHPNYDFNDEVIPLGASWFVNVVESRMPGQQQQ